MDSLTGVRRQLLQTGIFFAPFYSSGLTNCSHLGNNPTLGSTFRCLSCPSIIVVIHFVKILNLARSDFACEAHRRLVAISSFVVLHLKRCSSNIQTLCVSFEPDARNDPYEYNTTIREHYRDRVISRCVWVALNSIIC